MFLPIKLRFSRRSSRRRVRTSSRPRGPAKRVQDLVAPEEGGLQPDAAFFRGKTQDILLLHALHVLHYDVEPDFCMVEHGVPREYERASAGLALVSPGSVLAGLLVQSMYICLSRAICGAISSIATNIHSSDDKLCHFKLVNNHLWEQSQFKTKKTELGVKKSNVHLFKKK